MMKKERTLRCYAGIDEANVIPEEESFYYMKSALIFHYIGRYPEDEEIITEICGMVGKLLGAKAPLGAGGTGMISGWIDKIVEIEANGE